jgi:serine/threonine protein kinase
VSSKDNSAVTKLPSISALPVGVALQEFEITGVLGEGGFGIVYLARDRHLGREVAIKEYMPASLAARGTDRGVVVRSRSQQQTFAAGLQSFISEARLLAQFKHPALVEIFRFWEQNGTAYMAMPFYRGVTLKQHLKSHGDSVDEAWLRELLLPLLDGLEHLHAAQCYHRDIAPDNILILENGKPILLDFGAARRIVGDVTTGLTVILKPGYAPVEQYADDASVAQGPWTDVYGLAAICYLAVTRSAPPASVTRLMRDPLAPLVSQGVQGYSKQFLLGVDKGLAVRPENRPQSIAEFRRALGIDTPHAVGTQPTSALDTSLAAISVDKVASEVAHTVASQEPLTDPAKFPFLKGSAKKAVETTSSPTIEADAHAKPATVRKDSPKAPAPKPTPSTTPLDEDTVLMGSPPKADGLDGESPAGGGPRKRGKSVLVAGILGVCALGVVALLFSMNRESPSDATSMKGSTKGDGTKQFATPEPPSTVAAQSTSQDFAATAAQEAEKRKEEEIARLEAEKQAAEEKAKAEEKQKAEEKLKAMSGTVVLNIAPWGEVFVDGQSRGVSPPRKRLTLVEGRYSVMVRNGSFEPHLATIEVRRGEQVVVQHEFK